MSAGAHLLAVTASPAEADAVLRDLPGPPAQVHVGPYAGRCTDTPAGRLDVVVSGIGPAAAASATATALTGARYDLVLSLGIAGAFPGRADVGSVVVATRIVTADLGTHSPDGWLGVAELGWAEEAVAVPAAEPLAARLRAAGLPVVAGPVLTLSAMTGTDERAAELAGSFDPVAEAMEGAGVATAAGVHGVPVLEVRTVSNLVGHRDKSSWQIPRALDRLGQACRALLAQPLP